MASREPRFPGIDWYCDRCNAYLNSQSNFDDHHYIWKCTACGYKNSISQANILVSSTPSKAVNILGKTLGALRSAIVYLVISALCSIFVFRAELVMPQWILPAACIAYVVIDIFSMVFERKIAKYTNGQKLPIWILSSIFMYLWGDFIRPIYEPIHMIKVLIAFVFSKQKWLFNLVETLCIGLTYVVILIAFILSIVYLMNNATPNPVLDKLTDWINFASGMISKLFASR